MADFFQNQPNNLRQWNFGGKNFAKKYSSIKEKGLDAGKDNQDEAMSSNSQEDGENME